MAKKEFKGAPFPWKMNGESKSGKNSFNVIGTRLGGKYKIARVPFTNEYDISEAEANAKLIAAAPELLEALIEAQQQLAVIRGHATNDKIINGLTATIDKATAAINKALD